MSEGIATELHGIDLGDKRLNKRSQHIIEALAAKPQASVNAASEGWADTVAAYRFFDNPAVDPDKILEPHLEATKRRIKAQPVVLILQDTTELDFTSHPPDDAGCLNEAYRFGFYDHTHLAVTPERLSLGVVGGEQFDRTPESLGKARDRKTLPIEEKESLRWLSGYRLASNLAKECPDTHIVSVADREADIYDIFLEADANETPVDFVIRANDERRTLQRDPTAGPAAYRKVRDEVSASDLRFTQTIELPQTPKRSARTATLEIRAIVVTLKPPHARSGLSPITCNMVLVEEVNGPGDGTDVSWFLITSLPIDSVAEIQCIINYYIARWMIEVYFRILKTGCRVEEVQLETVDRVKRCLALYKIIAWRVMSLTYLNRECPGLPCSAVFEESEWKSVWLMSGNETLPKVPPTLGEFIPLLASLGGYNNRRTERPPGPQTIWIGLQRMNDFAQAWRAFNKQQQVVYN